MRRSPRFVRRLLTTLSVVTAAWLAAGAPIHPGMISDQLPLP